MKTPSFTTAASPAARFLAAPETIAAHLGLPRSAAVAYYLQVHGIPPVRELLAHLRGPGRHTLADGPVDAVARHRALVAFVASGQHRATFGESVDDAAPLEAAEPPTVEEEASPLDLLADLDEAVLVRTSFADPSAWEQLLRALAGDHASSGLDTVDGAWADDREAPEGIPALSDLTLESVGLDELLGKLPAGYGAGHLMIADAETFEATDLPILVVDLDEARIRPLDEIIAAVPSLGPLLVLSAPGESPLEEHRLLQPLVPDGAAPDTLLDRVPRSVLASYPYPHVAVVDDETLTRGEHPVLLLELDDEMPAGVRVAADDLVLAHAHLATGILDLEELASLTAEDGIVRLRLHPPVRVRVAASALAPVHSRLTSGALRPAQLAATADSDGVVRSLAGGALGTPRAT